MKAYLRGFGQGSLGHSDGIAAVNSFDLATEGGIMQNQEVLGKLRYIAQNNKTTGVDIAKAIQERVSRRRQGPETTPAQPQPQGPTPEPGLRPVPSSTGRQGHMGGG